MIQKEYTINNKLGLHARPASLFVKTTCRYQSSVKIMRGEHVIDGKSIMGLLLLSASRGASITISADGPDEAAAVETLSALVAADAGEQPCA
jgi:phosphotransferase system HPr (HPr) family protein